MRAHGWVGQAQYDLFVPFDSLAQSAFLELPLTQTKPLSEHETNTEQASRTNVSGQCEVLAKCERTLKLPQNAETGARLAPTRMTKERTGEKPRKC